MLLTAKSGARGLLMDLVADRPIRKVRWANLDTGEYEAFCIGSDGKIAFRDGKPLTYKGRSRLKFIPTRNIAAKGEPEPDAIPTRKTHKRLHIPLFDKRCEHSGCERIATWITGDEVDLAPVPYRGRLFSQAKTVAKHFWCSWHYEPPRLLSTTGELIKEFEEAGGVRPQ